MHKWEIPSEFSRAFYKIQYCRSYQFHFDGECECVCVSRLLFRMAFFLAFICVAGIRVWLFFDNFKISWPQKCGMFSPDDSHENMMTTKQRNNTRNHTTTNFHRNFIEYFRYWIFVLLSVSFSTGICTGNFFVQGQSFAVSSKICILNW